MQRLVNYLQNNWLINLATLIVYYLMVVLPHEKVGVVIAKIFEGTSRENYNLITLLIATTVFVLLLIILSKKLFAHKNKKVLIFYYSATVLFVVLCINVLFVMNVESIHFIQYAIFAILIYPLIKNFTQTIVFATIAGALDEVYQYFYLAPNRTDYFDWNDVIINLIGAAIGVLVLATLLSKLLKSNKTFFRSFTFYFLCLMALVVLALFGFNILSMYPVSNESTFALVKVVPEGFWSIPPGPYVKYHVVMPLEGILIIVVLCLFYSRLDNLIES